ncbi:MAG: Kazal-type serine protease inhibitor domain-containing protein [Bacteriovorax sp.]
MKICLQIALLCSLFLQCSCGADKLKSKNGSVTSGLSSVQQCTCSSAYSPVCGADGKDYENSCLAQCFKTTVKSTGHCHCETNTIKVCGADGQDHTECEAKAQSIDIVKYIPCAATEI